MSTASSDKLTIVFVGGLGRSGSTLLARVLAEVPGYVAVGELGMIWERGFTQNVRCGCGVPFKSCPFWTAVVSEAVGGFDGVPAAVLEQLRTFWSRRRWPLFALPALWTPEYRSTLQTYAGYIARLLRAVQTVSDARVIVDISKTPAHLVALAQVPDVEIHAVHLVRDSRAVAYSWGQTQRPQAYWQYARFPAVHPVKAAVLWNAVNVLLWTVRRAATTYRRLRYEDFARAPQPFLSEVVRVVGGGDADLRFADAHTVTLGVHHTVAGNPVRFHRGPIAVCEDTEWVERMPAATKLAVTTLTWPLLRAYGYA